MYKWYTFKVFYSMINSPMGSILLLNIISWYSATIKTLRLIKYKLYTSQQVNDIHLLGYIHKCCIIFSS